MCSVLYSSFYWQLLLAFVRFLKLGTFCPKVRPFLLQNLVHFSSKYGNNVSQIETVVRFLSWNHFAQNLGQFCHEVRLILPQKLGSKCGKTTLVMLNQTKTSILWQRFDEFGSFLESKKISSSIWHMRVNYGMIKRDCASTEKYVYGIYYHHYSRKLNSTICRPKKLYTIAWLLAGIHY